MTVTFPERERPWLVELPGGGWRFNPGRYVVCTRCSFFFDEDGHSDECQKCGAGVHWLEEHHDPDERDRRAGEVDALAVAAKLEYLARLYADTARRRALEGAPA